MYADAEHCESCEAADLVSMRSLERLGSGGWLYTRKSHTSIAHPYRIYDSARRSLSQAMAIVVMGCFCEGVFCCECG